MDDLVVDHYKEENKRVENDSKRAKVGDQYNSDDEENTKEVSLSRLVNECQTQVDNYLYYDGSYGIFTLFFFHSYGMHLWMQMIEIGGEEDVSAWGINVFGAQVCKWFEINYPVHFITNSKDFGQKRLLLTHIWALQKSPPPPVSLHLTNCHMFQSFMENELNSLVELSTENG